MKKPIFILIITILFVVSLSLVRVVVSSGLSTSGIDLGKIQEETAYYKTQNAILKEKLLSVTSFEYVASKASNLGFVESKNSLSLSRSIPLARKQ